MTETDGYWNYELTQIDGGQYAIITAYTGTSQYITVPRMVGGYPVIQLGAGGNNSDAKVFSEGITCLTIPSNVKRIGSFACYGALINNSRLAYLRIEGDVEHIGADAFNSCTCLKEITFCSATPCTDIGERAFSLGSPALGTAICTIYSPNNWAQDVIPGDIYGELTFEAIPSNLLYNPIPKLRYSYAEGTIPDFSVDFALDFGDGIIRLTVGEQEFTLTTSDFDEEIMASEGPVAPSVVMAYLYAGNTGLLAMSEGIGYLSLGEGQTLNVEGGGSSGRIACESGVITLSLTPPYGQTVEITDITPEWCYYPDPDGEYGWYDFTSSEEGPYVLDTPLCPGALYVDDLTDSVYIFYQDSAFSFSGEALPTPITIDKTVTDNRLTDFHWEAGGSTYPLGAYIAPISIPRSAELPPLEIPIAYDPATRRISVPKGYDMYGGATTDVNSVKLVFSGIVPAGENFIARVDFGVPVKVSDHVIDHPFILLEQNGDNFEAIIPNAALLGAKDTKKLPVQLVLANDSQVITSRNRIVLEVAVGIDSTIPGSDLPEYEFPEWPMPTGTTYTEDVHTVSLTYDPSTRTLTIPRDGDYGGATIDTNSVRINVSGIVPTGNDFAARIDYAAPIKIDEGTVIKPFTVLEQVGGVFTAMVPQAVLMAAKETKKLPIQLVTRHDDVQINSRNTIILEITRAINALDSVVSVYEPFVMYRNDTWAWNPNIPYDVGSVVTYEGDIYVAKQKSIGQTPFAGSEYWEHGDVAIELNGEFVSDPSLYAPVTSGTYGQLLISNGENSAPQWMGMGDRGEVLTSQGGSNPPKWQKTSKAYTFTSTAGADMTINHNLDSKYISCTFYDDDYNVIYPAYSVSRNSVTIRMNTSETVHMLIQRGTSQAQNTTPEVNSFEVIK